MVLIAAGAAAYWYFVLRSGSVGETQQQTTQSEASKPVSDKELTDLIADTSYLSTFSQSLELISANDLLKGVGPYTVFAPKNTAFNALPSGTLERLQKTENLAQLSSVMNYHIISGSLLTSQLTNGQKVKTTNGQELVIELKDKSIYLIDAKGNKALVTKSDIKAKNGVVHVVDAVLLPQ